MDIRMGNGFDVHRFGPGNYVTLCGVDIPHDQALMGHSDADVAMHAVTDAIYGALADGDIGQHFPPSESTWKDADSRIFLEHAVQRARDRGYQISSIDCTLICEFPKIGPHADAMRAKMAELMGVAPERISVKATTSEKLGFTGRGEGIAALATALFGLPMMRRLFLSCLGAGWLRPAPGTWGSLAALPLAYFVYDLGGPILFIIDTLILFALGVHYTALETKDAADHDPGWIVIDEVVGQWIALLPVAIGAYAAGVSPLQLWPGILAAFLLFRLFDIWKPWLVGRADRRGDAFGVMMDDVWAGIFAAILGLALASLAHGVMA